MSSDPVALLARYGRTFRLAGRFLRHDDLEAAASLYSFCRQVDDLADEAADPAAAKAALEALCLALRDDPGAMPLAARFAALADAHGIDREIGVHLVETVQADLGPVRIADEAALLRYAYGAAGTVGLMMCDLLGVLAPGARAHAIDLGIAMQLTNIARDVAEDAARDRLYLPAAWLPPGFAPDHVMAAPEPVFAAVQRMLILAERHYRSAAAGYRYLPIRARSAIRVAGRLYREIGMRILAAGPGYLAAGRCVVPRRRRLALLLREAPTAWIPEPGPGPHDPALHLALTGLPGTAD